MMATRATSEREGGRRRLAWRVAAATALVASTGALSMGSPVGAVTPQAVSLGWSALSSAGSPPPVSGASAVYDSDNKTVVLFGGMLANGALSNSTWVWNGSTWTDYPASSVEAPSPRQLAAMAFDPTLHQLILFGGEGPGGQPLGDTWAWNGASWYQPTLSSSQAPNARDGATLTYDGRGELILFGGTGLTTPTPPTTTTTTAPTTTTTVPVQGPVSTVATAAVANPTRTLSDTWRWDGSGWDQAPVQGPPARSGAAAAYDPRTGQTLLFGGQSTPTNTSQPHLLSDTWAWNGSVWTLWVPGAKSDPWPAARDAAVMAPDPLGRGVVLFGGTTSTGATNDTWLWTGSSWQAQRTAGSAPTRTGAAAALDGADRQIVVFGGTGSGGVLLSGTQGLGPAAVPPASAGPESTAPSVPRSASPAHTSSRDPKSTPTTTRPVTPPPGPPAGVTAPASKPLVLRPGQLVRLVGSGFEPGSAVTITFHSVPTVVGTTVASASGGFSDTVAVPASAAAGTHHFEATGAGREGPVTKLLATVDIELLPGAHAHTSTAEKVALVAIAVAIPIATWFSLVGASQWRRRRRATSP